MYIIKSVYFKITIFLQGVFIMTKAERFFNGIKDKKIAFIGTGVSHNDLIKLFLKKNLQLLILKIMFH